MILEQNRFSTKSRIPSPNIKNLLQKNYLKNKVTTNTIVPRNNDQGHKSVQVSNQKPSNTSVFDRLYQLPKS